MRYTYKELMQEQNQQQQNISELQSIAQKHKRKPLPKIVWILLITFLILFGVVFAKAWSFSSKLFVNHTSFFKKVTGIIFNTGIKGEASGKIRILMLGYGGEGHDGTYLTDSVILATINTDDKQILLQSIPRDYYWPQGQQKINFAYASGIAKANNGEKNKPADHSKGGEASLAAVQQITGLDIPYFVSVDFSGFEKSVDALDGITVNVENSFTDSQYPNGEVNVDAPFCVADDTADSEKTNCRYKKLVFEKGEQQMNGRRALEFTRSRHADGVEGSDFGRSKRQSQVIAAFKDKLQKLNILSNSGKISDILNIVADHAHTNMDPSEVLHLSKLVKDQGYQVVTENVDLENPLFCPKILDQVGYVILPCEDVSDSQIKDFFKNGAKFATIRAENSSVILENAGTNSALYDDIKKSLRGLGVTVYEVAYKGLPLRTSVLYQVNPKPATIRFVEDKLGIKSQAKPEQLKASSDLVLIVGGGQ